MPSWELSLLGEVDREDVKQSILKDLTDLVRSNAESWGITDAVWGQDDNEDTFDLLEHSR